MAESVILLGPQGSGKSLNAKALCQELGLQEVIELEDLLFTFRADRLEPVGQLILTCDEQQARTWSVRWGLRVIRVEEARTQRGAAWRTQP
ncbi:AAA family ATPase [Xanthomonas dyei]|uniref:AAA family ATPase n=1 Tax=Xanthomonas dyei TaxID=743699 RepID=UPI001E29FFDB|nr:AAA family ATPase [Xanthomonas dyei]MCC4635295.1 AAA family ATPase [Xanthomonas dyei pv. eucalypti]